MDGNIVGIIACVAIVVCGIGAYCMGRMAGMEWVLEHTVIEVIEEEKNDERGEDHVV